MCVCETCGSPDGADPVVSLLLAGGVQPVELVFPLHHSAFVLRLTGFDLLTFGAVQLQTELVETQEP